MAFDLSQYEPVADRIDRFWNDHPKGSIVTLLVAQDEKRFVVKAFVCKETTDVYWAGDKTNADATGYAEEIVGATPVNRASALENCETSAIGRALANLGYAPKGQRPSQEEMVKVVSRDDTERVIDDARLATDRVKECPDCGSNLYDNRDKNRQRVLEKKKPMPAFKCTNRRCTGADGEPWIAWEAGYFDDIELMVDRGNGEVVMSPTARDDYGPDEAPF